MKSKDVKATVTIFNRGVGGSTGDRQAYFSWYSDAQAFAKMITKSDENLVAQVGGGGNSINYVRGEKL